MLIATQAKNVSGTEKYFDQVLTRGDYYLGQEIAGHWHGKGVETFGLDADSAVTKKQFSNLLNGKHPETGKNLMQRIRKDRRPGMDLTFSVPKSVSLAWAINNDERIIQALRDSVQETMQKDVEPLMHRRVRDGKHASTKQSSQTGKLIYADFLHKTSRPVEGAADPHLHVHAFVINWTRQNGKHYAGEFHEIVRQRPSLQAKFEARLARRLNQELGYQVEHTRYMQSGRMKNGWELKGLERSTIEKFSRRTAQVEKFAKEKGIHDAEKKAQLGKKTREKKDTGKSVETLRTEWQNRLTEKERQAFKRLGKQKAKGETQSEHDLATQSLKYSLEHHLYRQSTAERHQIVGTALEHGLTLRPEQVEKSLDRMTVIQRSREVDGAKREIVTTREVLKAEQTMIAFARDGRGTRKAMGKGEQNFTRKWLNDQQKDAVRHVLQSRDTVMMVTGGAGTGKSSLLQEAAEAVGKNGKVVYTFAPSTGAKDVLNEKGFSNAQTVEHLLRNTEMQAEMRNQVIWVDEAGLLDVRSMNGLFKIAKDQNARVVLSGDTRQHASPRRGEAMRLLENEAGLNIARVEAIQRQKGRYLKAVELISRGHEVVNEKTGETGLLAGFDALDRMGKIKEIASEDRHELLASQYLKLSDMGKSTLVIAPTHAEGHAVTEHIRAGLRERGKINSEDKVFTQLKSLNLSQAEKGESSNYQGREGMVVQFHQNTKGGFKRGERYTIGKSSNGVVELLSTDSKTKKTVPLENADRFEIYSQQELKLAAGDKIRFSLGGKTKDQKQRLSNGRLDEIKGFDGQGNIILKGGSVVGREYGHLDLGYVVTSHASQGKDRQIAIAAMGSQSLPAINAKQFYVSVSRGSEDVMLFVDDKAKVRRAIKRSGEQLSATELVMNREKRPTQEASVSQELKRYSRYAFQSLRGRFNQWWKSRREQRQTQLGRHRETDKSKRFGAGITPDTGRSRAL